MLDDLKRETTIYLITKEKVRCGMQRTLGIYLAIKQPW
jgi:hypothetical protein